MQENYWQKPIKRSPLFATKAGLIISPISTGILKLLQKKRRLGTGGIMSEIRDVFNHN